ncbi:GNAT family N-acetyltransferase [Actinomadura keratinilytica]
MRITEDTTFGPDVVAFLEAHVAQMRSLSPPESKHALDLDGLRRPGIAFWTALDEEGALLGCGALAGIGPGHAELKSMRTDPARRRGGVATALLTHIVTEARLRGHRRSAWRPARPLLRPGPRPVRQARLRPVPALRLVPSRPPQHLHDARPRRGGG